MSIAPRRISHLVALALVAGCADSGHSLGNTRVPDAGDAGEAVSTGGATGTGGSHTPTGGSGGGGVAGSAGGRGGTSVAEDAGTLGDVVTGCGMRGESCASRACCSPLVCLSLSNPPSCYESYPPQTDSGGAGNDVAAVRDAAVAIDDAGCPVCPFMKCAYGSPIDDNGCRMCTCNPNPDGGEDAACPPEGCPDTYNTPCPSAPPADGSACLGQSVCNYEDCPGTGHTQASCRSGTWTVDTGACGTVLCLAGSTGATCATGQVCLVHAGGALLVDCIDNPCEPGLVSADCSTLTLGCTPILSITNGLTYYCDTCPAGQTCA